MRKKYKLGIIGGGFMAKSIADGALACGFLSPQEIAVSEPDSARARLFADKGIAVYTDNREVAKNSEYLLFAVKPQIFPFAAECLRGTALPVVISIMAGRTKNSIRTVLANENVRIARAMPNLPCSVCAGMTGIDVSELDKEEAAFVSELFSSVGKVKLVKEELLNAVTGISGSGPAYVFLFIQALTAAGVEHGFSDEEARELALQTVKGGAELVEMSPDKSLNSLIESVSSKGGTTVAALESFKRDSFEPAVLRAVSAAVKRAEELSE